MLGDKLLIWPSLLLCKHLEHPHSRQCFRSIHLRSCKSKKKGKHLFLVLQKETGPGSRLRGAKKRLSFVSAYCLLTWGGAGAMPQTYQAGRTNWSQCSHLRYCLGWMQTRLPQHDRPDICLSIHFYPHFIMFKKYQEISL